MIRILTFTSLYPNAAQPNFGVFVENRLRQLVATGEVEAKVIAPVPSFPFWYRDTAAAPEREIRHGIEIFHPRYLNIPKIGMSMQPDSLARAGLKAAKALIASGFDFDVIDAHYYYPDGVAAAKIARALGKPFTVTARGTDITLIPDDATARARILDAAEAAAHSITVCAALKDRMVELGADGTKITPLRNGVDLQLFTPLADRDSVRAKLGVSGPLIVSVGYLVERKGHHLTIEAMKDVPGATLLIAGSGPEEAALQAQITALGLNDRVRLLGQLPHNELPNIYGAADIMVLASSREGWANVLLESMACGTPVVATRIWGTPECVATPEAGRLCDRTAASIAHEINALLADYPDREATRRYASQFSWEATTNGQLTLFRSILGRPK